MKYWMIFLVVLLSSTGMASATCSNDNGTVRVGYDTNDNYCGACQCHYSDWQTAENDCVGPFSGNLVFELYAYAETTPLMVDGGNGTYSVTFRDVTSGYNATWNVADRFRAVVTQDSTPVVAIEDP